MWISKWKKLSNGDNQQREDNSSLAGGTTQINTPIEMIIFQWEYLFTPTPPIPSNML